MRRSFRSLAVLAAPLALAVVVSGCSTSGPAASGSSAPTPSAGSPILIVASTNVYGDIAEQIGGDAVSVTSIIDDPDRDPHEYQADAQNQLALSKAQIVIENGGGYDDFIDTMLQAANNPGATVLTAADLSGFDQNPADGSFNEHVWYDLPTVAKVVDRLTSVLTAADPAGAVTFSANAASFTARLTTIEQAVAAAASTDAGVGAAITEPVPLYLLTAMGFTNKTPEAFSAAVEEGTDAAPDVLQQTLALFTEHQVAVLVYNEQTSGPQTEAVLAAAKSAGIAVVPVTETLPAGETYLDWMSATVTAITAAVCTTAASQCR
ncbi:metal ABC transporter solute-binding protein, Zn/Mn family [Subtercola sp. YIM 133946]|uniref:metal ABC transporter solute-binding protein, Zn/Mn family n=1 Tax=Subtercola sp. YIM 133946 TaxID=3118909 RepID=UPI002F93D773